MTVHMHCGGDPTELAGSVLVSVTSLGLLCLPAGFCCIRHLPPDVRGCCVSRAMSTKVARWETPASRILKQASLA